MFIAIIIVLFFTSYYSPFSACEPKVCLCEHVHIYVMLWSKCRIVRHYIPSFRHSVITSSMQLYPLQLWALAISRKASTPGWLMLLKKSSFVTCTEHKAAFWLHLWMPQSHPWHLDTYVTFMHSSHPGVQYNKTTMKQHLNNTHPQWILAQPLSLGSIARFNSCTGWEIQTMYICTYRHT